MKEVKIILPELLEKLEHMDFSVCPSEDLLKFAAKTKAICRILSSEVVPTSPLSAVLNGLRHSLQRMEAELQRRNICLVEIDDFIDLIRENKEAMAEMLKSYPFAELLHLSSELERKTAAENGENSSWAVLLDLVDSEICRRSRPKSGVMS